ncbi:metallophosphoesterase family protein [Zavarzinella formosa]|uniref:metallophosphoesterase family protein n=1 Tax=Zavarzinella formosa TaxID=360055 RepID=UPI0003053879|nr:metallophosphoesterase [Zavarzinella formosa]
MRSVRPLRFAVAADLHYGTRHTTGNRATEHIAEYLRANPPDVILLAGDVGAGEDFERCLALFDGIDCLKAVVPGNHDIWVRSSDPRGDSRRVYEEYLPRVSREHGFHFLDHGPLELPDSDVAVVGSINWYDYTWDHELLKQTAPDWEDRLKNKHFSRGVHNDLNFVKWDWDDLTFTTHVFETLTRHLESALAKYSKTLVVTHHPPLKGLLYPAPEPPPLDALLWRAFSGNTRVEELLLRHADHIPAVWCGHTHWARQSQSGTMRGFNIGGDYHFKRLHLFDWPSGEVTELDFVGE